MTGLLKVSSISTTQDVLDSSGTNLANSTIIWNDSANSNYREQFTAIFNAANQTGQLFGNPRESKKVGGINTEVYTLSTNQTDLPMFNFNANIGGVSRGFEIVPSTVEDSETIYESNPIEGTGLTYTYRSDGSGDSSNNTGFFFLFKQGTIQQTSFTVDSAITNYIYSIDTPNINNTDVCYTPPGPVWSNYKTVDKSSPLLGNNAHIILAKSERDIYNVVTKLNDLIDLVFGDGNFSTFLGSLRFTIDKRQHPVCYPNQ